MKKETSFPTFIGLILLLITILAGARFTQHSVNTSTKANDNCQPLNPQVTNVTYNSASVSFTTSSNCDTTLNLNDLIINDSRNKGTVHYFEITSLENSKVYQFTIISDGNKFTSDNYNFKTAKKPDKDIPSSNLAWGRVLKPDKSVANEAIVYLNISGASPLSALVTSSGNWNVPLSTSFNESLADWFIPPNNFEENLVVIAPGYDQTQIVGNTSHNNPVPDIILGQNIFDLPQTISDPENDSLLDNNYDLTSPSPLDISNPKTNEKLSTKRPDFFGTGSPKSTLKIKVESPTVITGEAEVESDGSWNWSPNQDLTPGEHTITITDENNNAITRKFIVLAAESNTSFSASSSANTVTPTPVSTQVPTPTPTIKPTLAPTSTPIPVVHPNTSSGVPRSGNNLFTIILFSSALISLSFALIYYKKN